jgi:hypothetical protein
MGRERDFLFIQSRIAQVPSDGRAKADHWERPVFA